MATRAELRKRAREALGNNIFKAGWLFALLAAFITQAILSAAGFTYVLPLILTGPLMMGLYAYFLGRARRTVAQDSIGTLFNGFKGDVGGNILTGLLISVFTALWTILFIIPGIVKSYAYSMAYFIKLDHPEYTATQAITESRKLMKGHKMNLFLLDLSFLGWMIVGALCLGIGTLWVTPYQYAARAEFYKEITGNATAEIPVSDSTIVI